MKTNFKKVIGWSLITAAILVMSGCGNDKSKDEPSSNYSNNNENSSSSSSADPIGLYDVYRVQCLKIVSTTASSYDDWYKETRYIWVDKVSNKKYLCKNDYSFNMIGLVKDNSYSSFKGYPVYAFKYHTNDPSYVTSNFDYFYDDGTFVKTIEASGSSSGGDDNSGNSGSTTPSKCSVCNGSGKCPTCHGSGRIGTSSFGVTCSICKGTGICKYCNGTGY